ncbi:MAG: hypothetical protein ACRDU4_03345 [Mycobacterium sp.]
MARRDDDAGTERALERTWQLRLQQRLRANPALAAELQRLLDQVLTPALTLAEQARVGTIIMTGSSHDSSTFTQIGTQVNCRLPEQAFRPWAELAVPTGLSTCRDLQNSDAAVDYIAPAGTGTEAAGPCEMAQISSQRRRASHEV